ncbi:MAG: cytochrome c biogenesis protein ResB [Bdellovibrionaceae bacterium]|nr:cytochrome c biogenesis protein ResB [Pseudobdellovibrionaceae bacterium]
MSDKRSGFARLMKSLASLKLAVIIMLGLSALIAWGTIVEARFDAEAARKLVYDTIWMEGALLMLAVSLIAVMVDRWPWKKKHAAFVLAHIGILFILFGGILTMKYGLDGQMTVEIGKSSRHVVLPMDTDLLVYASFGGANMTKLHEESVDYFRRPPTPEKPTRIRTDDGDIEFIDYKKYVLPSRKVVPTEEKAAGPGLRFQIQNPNVSVVEWLVQRQPDRPASHDFGPARIHLGTAPQQGSGHNEIWLTPLDDGRIHWTLFRRDSVKPAAAGITEEGGQVQTGWMGLELRVLRFYPKARENWDFEERPAPTPLTTSAVKLRFRDREQWILLNDTVRLFTDSTAYMVSYINRRIDLGFPVKLDEFQMIPYQGTSRAKEYKSRVQFPDQGPVEISMNEPGEYKGLTFYQASFQNDDQGRPIASVFSVNYDPGRWWKYLGSLIMSCGVVALFWMRRLYWPKPVGGG